MSAAPDAAALSALMCSRVCHDLINPVGALASGLEVLNDPTTDPDVRSAALELIASSAEKSVALLKYARLAYGAAGGVGAELPFDEAKNVLSGMFAFLKAELDWRIAPSQRPKEEVRAILVLALAAADCAPRGGVVRVSGGDGAYEVRAEGARIIVQDEMAQAINGVAADLKPKFTPHYLTGVAARASGGGATLDRDGEAAVFRVEFAAAAKNSQTALTAG
jgi:histidine phosphotransferase ChpT